MQTATATAAVKGNAVIFSPDPQRHKVKHEQLNKIYTSPKLHHKSPFASQGSHLPATLHGNEPFNFVKEGISYLSLHRKTSSQRVNGAPIKTKEMQFNDHRFRQHNLHQQDNRGLGPVTSIDYLANIASIAQSSPQYVLDKNLIKAEIVNQAK